MRIVVLGAGRVGGAMAVDLAAERGTAVTVVDRDAAVLRRFRGVSGITPVVADLTDPARVVALAREHDLVVGAVPAHLGFQTLRAVIESGRHMVDISFFEQDPLELDDLARSRGVVAIVDAGVAPGLSNLLLGRLAASARVERFVCYVGGLPAVPSGLFRYKAPFSPIDVIELYTRPARYREAGGMRVVPALSGLEQIEFPGVGVLDAFLTDGLRTVLRMDSIPEMREMTLRYPGHADQMKLLRDMGLFDSTPVEVGGNRVVPRELAARLLFPLWQFAPGEPDLTVMRVEIDAADDGGVTRHTFDLLDRYDERTGTSSMARTTGYTGTGLARLVVAGQYTRPGVSPLEDVGRDAEAFARVMAHLAARGVVLQHRTSQRPG